MKNLSNFLIIVGTIFIVFCIAGYILISSTGINSAYVDRGIGLYNAVSSSELFASDAAQIRAWDSIKIWLMQYRTTNLFIGIAALMLGIIYNHLAKIYAKRNEGKHYIYVPKKSLLSDNQWGCLVLSVIILFVVFFVVIH